MSSPPPLHLTTLALGATGIPFGQSADPFERNAIVASLADILVIAADLEAAGQVCRELQSCGFNPVAAFSGEEGLSVLNTKPFSLVLLDWMLPGCNGLEVLKTLRARGHAVPVFLLSMLGTLEDRVLGLESGADDFLVKPFAFPELLARMRARLRRMWTPGSLQRCIADLVLHVESRRVQRGAEEIALTPREFDLLQYLATHHGTVVTREMLAQEVWRVARNTPSLQNAIDVHVANLRRKIDAAHAVKLLHTVRGEGFVLMEKPSGRKDDVAS